MNISDEPDVVLAYDGDPAGELVLQRLLDRRYPRPLPLRSEATWEVDAQREHWNRMAVECDGAGEFFAMCRDAIRACEIELERRRKLRYRQATSPYDWPEALARIKRSADLLAVIGARRPDCVDGHKIKFAGQRILLRCPFHVEKTASCVIYLNDQHYFCFACKAHGDAIDAVQKLDQLTFVQAVERLANELRIELPKGRS